MTRNIPHDADEIPSLAALLNERERQFVKFMIQSGGNKTLSAMMAGYSPSNRDAAAVTGFNLAKRPRIAAAITDLCRVVLGSDGIAAATAAYLEIASDPTHKDRAKAAGKLIDLAFPPSQRDRSRALAQARRPSDRAVQKLSLEFGVPLANMLGPKPRRRSTWVAFDAKWSAERGTSKMGDCLTAYAAWWRAGVQTTDRVVLGPWP